MRRNVVRNHDSDLDFEDRAVIEELVRDDSCEEGVGREYDFDGCNGESIGNRAFKVSCFSVVYKCILV